ncbi:MAG: phosphopyruvate hydratase [Candidatus Nealsonbacteria bacterium]|nr:MAG: phosphopyruvate hydratase [Candidatus Nealsonbacteria bacterium]
MSTIIEEVKAREILNSRGNPTIEVDIFTLDGFGRASAPSGASTGRAEAVPFPEGGVKEAVKKVEEAIAPEIIGLYADDQEEIDAILHEIDGTENFRNIGGNTAYAVSLAVADAAADSYGLHLYQYLGGSMNSCLPYPLGNVIGGGKHASGKATDIQEFLVLPLGAESFSAAVEANAAIHRKLKGVLGKLDASFTGGKGDEGAWAPNISNDEALEALSNVCQEVAEELGFESRVGVDVAASSLWDPEKELYVYKRDNVERDSGEQIEYILSLIEKYNLVYVEDPLREDDFEGFKELTSKAHGCLICGDDLFVTNVNRLRKGISIHAGNAIIIKMNQVGTLTDTWKATRLAQENGYVPVVSHRSGETEASHIAHLAVALNAPIIKTGVVGGERIAKLNELIRIEDDLGERARMASLKI